MTNIKNNLKKAATKIKKAAAVGTLAGGMGAALLFPTKGNAQTADKDNLEKQKMAIVLDTLRMGMEVKNESSKDKGMTINIMDVNSITGDEFAYYTADKDFSKASPPFADEKGGFFLLDKRVIKKVSDNSYTYNTDTEYDKYLSIIQKVFPVKNGCYIHIDMDDVYTSIMVAKDSLRERYNHVIISNNTGEFVYVEQYSTDKRSHRYMSFLDNVSKKSMYKLGILNRPEYEIEIYLLREDGSGFIDNPPGNMIKPKANVKIDNSKER
jgi:hypothetical protein